MSPAPTDPVASLVREADFGRYAASLYAPIDVRPHLLALYAFDIETSRVRDLVSEPMPGELRLQWWRDALEDPSRADANSHPVARALEAAIAFGRLPREALIAMIDARTDDLYDDPVDTTEALEARLGATDSACLRLASLIVARGEDPGGADVSGLGGVAWGLVRRLAALPRQAARGQILLPVERMAAHGVSRDELLSGRASDGLSAVVDELRRHARRRLAEARRTWPELVGAAGPAFLPLALVELELAALERSPPLAPVTPPRWRMLWRLWRMSRRAPPF